MNSLAMIEREVEAASVDVTTDELIVNLVDGRRISVPLTWYPRLLHGSMVEKKHYELIGRGQGIHWPDLDEDISVRGLLNGNPSFEAHESLQRWLDARHSAPA